MHSFSMVAVTLLPGPVTYRFRVLSRYEADFPFLAGTSNVVGVYER